MDTYAKTVEILRNRVFFKGEDITIKVIANAMTCCNVFFSSEKSSIIYELVPKKFDDFIKEQLSILDIARNIQNYCKLSYPLKNLLYFELNVDYKVINNLLYKSIIDIDKVTPNILNFIIINYILGKLTFKEIKFQIKNAIEK